MFTYTAKEIIGQIHDHYTICPKSGMVVHVFGWGYYGNNENLRQVLHDAIGINLDIVKKHANETGVDFAKLAKTFFKTCSVREAITKATEDHDNAMKFVATLEALRTRIWDALDVPRDERSKSRRYTKVSDALLEECRRYITVSLLNMDWEFTLNSPLIKWNTDENKFYKVESDFTISTWRVGMAGCKNKVRGRAVLGLELFYLVHNLETDQTFYQVGCNPVHPETGNFERRWNTYSNGEYIPDGEVYYADIKDAVAIAQKGIADLNRKNRATMKAANERLDAIAA